MVTALEIQHQDDLKKWKNRRTDTWRNGASKKMDYHLVHTKPPPPKMDVIPKTFLQIILAATWLVWHSSTSPKPHDNLCLTVCLILLLCLQLYVGKGRHYSSHCVLQMSLTLCLNPIYLMLTCSICCSYAFMLPVATAPNAIVFSHSTMKTSGIHNHDLLRVCYGSCPCGDVNSRPSDPQAKFLTTMYTVHCTVHSSDLCLCICQCESLQCS